MASVRLDAEIRVDARKTEREVRRALGRAEKGVKLKLDDRSFTQPLGRITGNLNEFQKSIDASNARVVAFAASAGILYKLTQAFEFLVKTTIDVEKQLKDINVVLGASSGNLKKFSNELFSIAGQTGQSFKAAAEAATEFSRQGLGLEKTLKRTKDALVLARLSGMDTVEATNALTAAVNSFSSAALTTTQIVNKLATVDAAFAVSSTDLAEAIKRSGASAQAAGVEFDQLLAIVTAVQERTARGGAVIGNSLKTIFTRVARPEVLNQLHKLGVAVEDTKGRVLPAMKILEGFAQKFDQLSDSTKATSAELLGGVFQVNNLKAALFDLGAEYSRYKKAVEVAGTATHQATLRNEELNTTLSARLNKSMQHVSRLASDMGELTVKPSLNVVLDWADLLLPDPAQIDKSTRGISEMIGEGLLRGLGQFMAGPGLVGGIMVVGKFLKNFAVFARQAIVDIGLMSKKSQEIRANEHSLRSIYTQNLSIVKQLQDGTITRAQAEERISAALAKQASLMATISGASKAGAAWYGVATKSMGSKVPPGRSSGHIPTASHGFVPQGAAMAEIAGAYAAGYTPGQVRSTNISGIGKVVYNTREKIKKIPGMSQPAIIPPASSKGGQAYRKNFEKVNGFTPAAGGLTPDYEEMLRLLKEDEAKKAVSRRMSRAANRANSPLGRIEAMTRAHGGGGWGSTATRITDTGDLRAMGARGEVGLSNKAKKEVGRVYANLIKKAEAGTLTMEHEAKARKHLVKKYKIASSSMDLLSGQVAKQVEITSAGNAAAEKVAQQQQEAKAARAQKFQNIAMGTALLLPMIMGGVQTAFRRENEKTGADALFNRQLGAGTGAISTIGGTAAMGAMIGGGLPGAAVGAGVGTILALPDIIDAFSSELPELKKDFELMQERLNSIHGAAQGFEKSLMLVEKVFTGEIKGQKATDILTELGNSYGRLPAGTVGLAEQNSFMDAIHTFLQSKGTDEAAIKRIREGTATILEGGARQQEIQGQHLMMEQMVKDRGMLGFGTTTEGRASSFAQQMMQADQGGGKTMQGILLKKFMDSNIERATAAGEPVSHRTKRVNREASMIKQATDSHPFAVSRGAITDKDIIDAMPSELKARFKRDFTSKSETVPSGGRKISDLAIRNELSRYIEETFEMLAFLKDFKPLEGEEQMDVKDFHNQIKEMVDWYGKLIRRMSEGIELYKGALNIEAARFSAQSQGFIALQSGQTDSRNIARLQYEAGVKQAQLNAQKSFARQMPKHMEMMTPGRLREFFEPYINLNEMGSRTSFGPWADAVNKQMNEKYKAGPPIIKKTPPTKLGLQRSAPDRISTVMPGGSKSRTEEVLDFLHSSLMHIGASIKAAKGPFGEMDSRGNKELSDARRAAGDRLMAIYPEFQKKGRDESDRLKKERLNLEEKELALVKSVIAIRTTEMAQIEAHGIKYIAELQKIQQANMKAFGGGISGFSSRSGTARSTEFQVNRMGMGMRGISGRQKGQMALQNLDSWAQIARLLPEREMSGDMLKSMGGGQLKSSLVSHYDIMTKGMGMNFTQGDLERIAQSQIDQRLKPTDEDLAIPLQESMNDILKSLHDEGFSIKNVDEMASKIYNAVKAAREGGPNPSKPDSNRSGNMDRTGWVGPITQDGDGLHVTIGATSGDIRGRRRTGSPGIGFPTPVRANQMEAKSTFLDSMGEGFFMNTSSFADGMKGMGNMMSEISNDLRTGFKGALREAMFSAESLSDALRTAAVSLLDNLSSKIFDVAFDAMFNAAGVSLGFGKGAKGGYVTTRGIQGFAGGGLVRGGTGFRDDVPAMLSQGEFVVRKSAVDKYGAGNLNALNLQGGGGVNLNAPNTLSPNDPKRPTSFKYNISPRLSALAVTDEDRPDVARRRSAADAIMRNNMQHQKAMQAYKAQQSGRLIQAYTSAAMMFASYGMVKGAGGFDQKGAGQMRPGANPGGGMYNVGRASGGFIPGFASGGYVDNVPAMLMGGEMVMNRDAVNKHGRGFFEKINKGQAQGFAEGGFVGGLEGSESSGSGSFDLIDRLIESNEALKSSIDESKFGKNNENSGMSSPAAASSANNNVTVNINIDKGGSAKSDASASSNGSGNADSQRDEEQKAIAMSESIRTACLDVILNEKRPGGALSRHGISPA